MNVASLELCKELYELSGWVDEYWQDGVPVYPLGYLLRKLRGVGDDVIRLATGVPGHWVCGYSGDDILMSEVSDTPEDAACKLAIELFKQGILK